MSSKAPSCFTRRLVYTGIWWSYLMAAKKTWGPPKKCPSVAILFLYRYLLWGIFFSSFSFLRKLLLPKPGGNSSLESHGLFKAHLKRLSLSTQEEKSFIQSHPFPESWVTWASQERSSPWEVLPPIRSTLRLPPSLPRPLLTDTLNLSFAEHQASPPVC